MCALLLIYEQSYKARDHEIYLFIFLNGTGDNKIGLIRYDSQYAAVRPINQMAYQMAKFVQF